MTSKIQILSDYKDVLTISRGYEGVCILGNNRGSVCDIFKSQMRHPRGNVEQVGGLVSLVWILEEFWGRETKMHNNK